MVFTQTIQPINMMNRKRKIKEGKNPTKKGRYQHKKCRENSNENNRSGKPLTLSS